MSDYISGKVIIVTGASGGFGRLVCEKAAALGARLMCADIDERASAATAASIEAASGEALSMRADVTDIDEMRALTAFTVEQFGRVDVMVNNAGVMPLAFYADHGEALGAWHRCIDINIKGVLNGTVAVYDQMIEQGRGHIVNLSSIYGNFYQSTLGGVGG